MAELKQIFGLVELLFFILQLENIHFTVMISLS